MGEGRVPAPGAGVAGTSTDGAFVGSVATTTGFELAIDSGVREAAISSADVTAWLSFALP
jgi:hypothetical protein